ncbi:MAG: acetolactate synthase large subunit [Alphaproteobacteria bacterium]
MNGAESLVRTLVNGGVTVSFTNPGTSEMHFVAALDRVEGMACVLCLHETVATGAADGYYRMTGGPASTLLHLGPGLANGLSNLHNLRRARSGVVNIVGEHATYHRVHDAPLTADIEGIAPPMSHWVKTSETAKEVAADGATAIQEASRPPGRVATLILPADTAWTEGSGPAKPLPKLTAPKVDDAAIEAAATALLSGVPTMLFLGAGAVRDRGSRLASSIAQKTGAKVLATTSIARMERVAGHVALDRLPYPVDAALKHTGGLAHMILVGTPAPVAFFAYPGKPSSLVSPETAITALATHEDDVIDALERLAERVGAANLAPILSARREAASPKGPLNPDTIAAVIAAHLPEGAVVTDESVTTGRGFFPLTHGAAPHDWLQLTGGSIGEGLPLAVGAAVASPGRRVVALQADGSGMYSLQALWTMARERLDVTVCIWANSAYAILKGELANVGAKNPGRKAHDMLSLADPTLNWVKLAAGMGVEGTRVETAEAFADVFASANRRKGPFLIEVVC